MNDILEQPPKFTSLDLTDMDDEENIIIAFLNPNGKKVYCCTTVYGLKKDMLEKYKTTKWYKKSDEPH